MAQKGTSQEARRIRESFLEEEDHELEPVEIGPMWKGHAK